MYKCIRQLSAASQRSVVPRLSAKCHSNARSNSPTYTPLLDLVGTRQEQARRSVLVQVAGPNSALDLASYCHEQFGDVESLHYFNNKSSNNFTHFFIVNFSDERTVNSILNSAQHSVTDGLSATPVPVYSPFLWLQGGKVSRNIDKFKTVPVDYGHGAISEQKIQTMSDVSEQMYHLWQRTEMTDTSLRLRFLVCRQLELAIAGMFPHAKVLPFGSAINGFGTCESDQDMVLDLDNPDRERGKESRLVFQAKGAVYGGDKAQVQRHCEELANIIQSFLPGCQDVQKILNARVPIIKYTQELVGLECDLSMSSSSGLHMSCLLHLWGHMDWRVRPLVATVRRWARSVGLVREMRPTPFFTNFTLTMLVICYLQTIGMLPNYSQLSDLATESDTFTTRDGVDVNFLHNINHQKEMLNKCYHSDISLQDLLQGFFTHYATYDFGKNVLCPITGTNKMKTKRWKHSSHLDMINPLEPTLNVSYNVGYKGLEQFKEECRKGIKKLNNLKQSAQEESPVKDGLFWLFKNESAPPTRPRLVIPSLKSLDLGSGKENQGGKKSKSSSLITASVKDYFDKNPSPDDTKPRLQKTKSDEEKSLDLGSEKENQGGKKSRSGKSLSVNDFFYLNPSPEDTEPSLKKPKSDEEKLPTDETSVKDNFDLNPSPDDNKPSFKKTKSDEEKSPADETSHSWKMKTESGIWSEIDKIHEQDDLSKPSKLLSSKKLSSLFNPSIVPVQEAKPGSNYRKQLREEERLERLKTKYLRKPSSKSFKQNL